MHLFISLIILFVPLYTEADMTTVVNSVSVSSDTGGNTASAGSAQDASGGAGLEEGGEGKIITSEAHSSVEIKTIIDGEVVTDIEEEHRGNGVVEIHTQISTSTSRSYIENDVSVSASVASPVFVEEKNQNKKEEEEKKQQEVADEVSEEGGTEAAVVVSFWKKVSEFFKHVFSWFTSK